MTPYFDITYHPNHKLFGKSWNGGWKRNECFDFSVYILKCRMNLTVFNLWTL